jgi:NADH:ubiquinone oxidoreductase subunit F (NADH-binding)
MGVLGPDQLDIKLDFDDVRFRGGCLGLGTAGMIVMNEHTDMVAACATACGSTPTKAAASARPAAKAPAG